MEGDDITENPATSCGLAQTESWLNKPSVKDMWGGIGEIWI